MYIHVQYQTHTNLTFSCRTKAAVHCTKGHKSSKQDIEPVNNSKIESDSSIFISFLPLVLLYGIIGLEKSGGERGKRMTYTCTLLCRSFKDEYNYRLTRLDKTTAGTPRPSDKGFSTEQMTRVITASIR